MPLSTVHLDRCIETLDGALSRLAQTQPGSLDHDILRNAAIKGFELTLETSGKLLRRALKTYEPEPRSVDEWAFKHLLRQAARHGLMSLEEVERWFVYRDNRNTTAHDYGKGFAEETLRLMPGFLADAGRLSKTLLEKTGHADD